MHNGNDYVTDNLKKKTTQRSSLKTACQIETCFPKKKKTETLHVKRCVGRLVCEVTLRHDYTVSVFQPVN